MAFDFLATKKAARQALHETLAVSSIHISAATGERTSCRIRVHTRIKLVGDVDYQGFAELSEGMVLIHFDKLEASVIQPATGDLVEYDTQLYQLDTKRDDDGIYLDSWYAIRKDE